MALQLVTPPAFEPLSRDEVKQWLRVEIDDDNTLIDNLIVYARERAEHVTRRALITQTWNLYLDIFQPVIEVPFPPLQSISSINYVNTGGVLSLMDPSIYLVDAVSEPGRITPAYGKFWLPILPIMNAVVIQFVAGYGADPASVPEGLKTAMKTLISTLYENRESYISGVRVTAVELPFDMEDVFQPYRILSY